MKQALFGAALVFAFAAAAPAWAQSAAGDWAFGGSLGTPGVGVELKRHVNAQVDLRATIDGAGVSRGVRYDEIRYDGKLRMLTGGAFVDLHPFAGKPFLLSGGAYIGRRKIDLHATPTITASVTIGDVTYTGSQVGELDGAVMMSKVTPFAGLGFDNSFTHEGRWGFKALAGVAFSKRPEVTLVASGPFASNPQFQAELARERAKISDDAKAFRYFPAVQVGLSYRF